MTRQQDADAMLVAHWTERRLAARESMRHAGIIHRAERSREARRRQAARELRAGMIWDAVACALVFGVIGAAFLIPWGAL